MSPIGMLRVSSIGFGLAVLLATSPFVLAEEQPAAVDAAIRAASTAEQHKALADRYRGEAAEARKAAESHKAMKEDYQVARRTASVGEHMERHCDNLIRTYESQASEYEAMAAEHDALAAKAAAAK